MQGSHWTFVTSPRGTGAPPDAGIRLDAAPLAAVDDVRATVSGDAIELVATRRIDVADPHLEAHFPAFKIFPGVFVIESLRQAVRSIFIDRTGAAPDITAVRSVRFVAPLLPGDHMRLKATLKASGDATVVADATAFRSEGDVAVRLKVDFGVAAHEVPDGIGIQRCLPHGHPMLLVDRIVALEAGKSIVAIKAVSATEPCYRHLPRDVAATGYAYPVTLMLESFGQAAAVLWIETAGGRLEADDVVILNAARSCRIDGRAYPGDVLRHVARIDNIVGTTVLVTGETWVGKRRVATIESMMATIRKPLATDDGDRLAGDDAPIASMRGAS